MRFRIKALGSLVATDGEGPVGGAAAQRRTLALLVLIAAARGRGVTRDKLIGLLWPETTEERARHAFAQTLYRLRQQFGADAVESTDILRLNSAVLTYDVADFTDAIARADLELAAQLYEGPFLDGFVLPGAPDFERWVEEERARLAGVYQDLLERLAEAATAASAHGRAAEWWRARVLVDPLNSRVAAQLVRSLVVAGDRAAALQYARVHEELVKQELDGDPGPEFRAALTDARRELVTMASLGAPPVSESVAGLPRRSSSDDRERIASQSGTFAHTAETLRVAIPKRSARRALVVVGVLVLSFAALAYPRGAPHDPNKPHVVAVGPIADYTGGDTGAAARVLPEMLSTNLSRLAGIAMVPRSRMLEFLPAERTAEPDARDLSRAARQAGADVLLEGALYRRPDGLLRLDLRVLDLKSGEVRQVHEAEAADPFALADSATLRIAAGFNVPVNGALRIVDVTTQSLVAYRFYEEGLRALRKSDRRAALRLFDAALAADSNFAMAAFGALWASDDYKYLDRAVRLSDRVTDRERLVIRSTWARRVDHPSSVAIAETLAARYPADPESHLVLGQALSVQGEFAGARRAARQAFAMDSMNLGSRAARCVACEALDLMFWSYYLVDSLEAAERVARDWTARDTASPVPWLLLRAALLQRDTAAASAAYERARRFGPTVADGVGGQAELNIRNGDFEAEERALQPILQAGTRVQQVEALWWMIISQRHQGRWREAYANALRVRKMNPGSQGEALLHAQVLFEMGQPGAAAAIFDTAVTVARPRTEPSNRARHVSWAMVHRASALAAAGEISALEPLADSLEAIGALSGYGRDPRLHHHVRGLIHAAHGQKEQAVAEFRLAIWSPVSGYTRTNVELAKLLIELGRPNEAVPVLRAALHAGVEASNLYVTHTEVHALLASAFRATDRPDSATTHRRWVERALVHADPDARTKFARLMGK